MEVKSNAGHLMQRTDSVEKILMLGKIEGGRRRGRQRMRWLDGIIDPMDVSLSKLQDIEDRGAWWATVHRVAKSQTGLKQNHSTRSLFNLPQFNSVQSLSDVRLFVTPWTAARQTSPSITSSQSLLKLMSIESMMPSNHLILCRPLLLLLSIFSSIRNFSNKLARIK